MQKVKNNTQLPEAAPCLPQEVVEDILDYLRTDSRSLHACSLVCKAWVPRSSYHLFRHILLTAKDIPKFRTTAIKCPRICLNVAKLSVVASQSRGDITDVVLSLPHIQSLRVTCDWMTGITVRHTRRRIDHLELHHLRPRVSTTLLRAFTSIRKLVISECFLEPDLVLPTEVSEVTYASARDPYGGERHVLPQFHNSQTFTWLKLDLRNGGGRAMHLSPIADSEIMESLLHTVGEHIEHLEYVPTPYSWSWEKPTATGWSWYIPIQ